MIRSALLAVAAAALAGGCTAITAVDDRFLQLDQPDADTTPPDCTDIDLLVESGEGCWDRCDNDSDDLVDCDDPECEHYCCERGGVEFLNCTDACDNDHDEAIDCDDTDCAGAAHCNPPPVLEGVCRGLPNDPDCCADGDVACCSNGLDDDGDGRVDCDDPGCVPTDFCCGSQTPHVDQPNRSLDANYWDAFGGEGPLWNSFDRVSDWRDRDGYAGAATAEPVNLDFGLSVTFNVAVTAESACYLPWDCAAFSGIAIGPSPAPRDGEDPSVHMSVLVTSARRVVVTRGDVGSGWIVHTIGLPEPYPGYEGPPVIYSVSIDLTPATDEYGFNGYTMRLTVPNGREVCHPETGSIIGCPEEPEWESDGLVLYEEDNVLSSDERGAHLLVLGRGAGVELSDHADDAGSETVTVGLRSCANPTAWTPAADLDVPADDDRVTNASLCWAVAGLGSGSVVRRSSSPPAYAMVVAGTTERIFLEGLGINNYSLGFLTSQNDPDIKLWDQVPEDTNINRHRYTPIDVERDVNCMGLEMADYPDPTCWADGSIMPSPAETDDVCRAARSHRSPYVIAAGGTYTVLYSEASGPGSHLYEIAAAEFVPTTNPEHFSDQWRLKDQAHRLTPLDVELATGRRYLSLRDPVGICHPGDPLYDTCEGQTYMILLVGEPEIEDGSPWTGDELIYVEYNLTRGFDLPTIFRTLGDLGPPELNPLAGRYLAEPWIELYDDDVSPAQYFVWVTTNETIQPTQVDLLLVQPDWRASNTHPLVIDAERDGSGATWTLFPGSPVLTSRDLELLYPRGDLRAVDCSGSCDIGGVTATVVANPDLGRDTLHLWVSVAERPLSDASPRFLLRHLVQPFGLP